jgi:hypothetical protein
MLYVTQTVYLGTFNILTGKRKLIKYKKIRNKKIHDEISPLHIFCTGVPSAGSLGTQRITSPPPTGLILVKFKYPKIVTF